MASRPRTNSKSYLLWLRPSLHARLMAVRERTGKPAAEWLRGVLERELGVLEEDRAGALRALAAAERARR